MEAILQKFRCRGIKLPDDNQKYKILSYDGILENEINKIVHKSLEIFQDISIEDCQKLLYDFNWDYNELFKKFTDSDSYDNFLQENKIDLSIPLSSETMINSCILSNPLLKKCPNKIKECTKIVKIESSDISDIQCECGFTFCFKCENIPHSPFPCILISEWIKQCEIYDAIVENNNTICPFCNEVFDIDNFYHGIITCTNCGHLFNSLEHLIEEISIFPDYKYSIVLSERLEKIVQLKETLKHRPNGKFLFTVTEITQTFLEKILPIPLFWFFLDKEYLSKNSSSTTNFVPMFEFSQIYLERSLSTLLKVIEGKASEVLKSDDVLICDEEENNILDYLHKVQQHLVTLYKYINETEGWVFKLHEIQEAFEKINKECDNEDCENEEFDDEGDTDCGNDEDDGSNEESDDVDDESSWDDDGQTSEDSFVHVE